MRTDSQRAIGRRRALVASAILLIGGATAVHAAEEPDFAAGDCADAGCHAPLTQFRHMHPAVEDAGCEGCHYEGDDVHSFEAVEEAPALCESCHDLEDGGVWEHASGDALCTDCHDPHGSRWEKMLVEPVRDLCRSCHDAPGVDREFAHRPAEEGRCTSCHHPHRVEEPPLLRAAMPELCVRCHRDKRPIEGESGAHLVELGEECTTCHQPHGSDLAFFLEESYSQELYLSEIEEDIALCLGCHGDLVEEDADTAFRASSGENLHQIHVGIEGKGRNCRDCHEMHARKRYRLLRKDYRMQDWSAQMLYSRDETEATCGPACHEPRTYPIEE
jgi:predicted CXXCH cytochrome family protein